MKDQYTITYLSSADQLHDYKAAFDKNGSEKNMDNLTWMHINNPLGISKVCQTYAQNGELAGIYATMNVAFKIGDTTQKACQSLDTLTDASHRGHGLFKQAAQSVSETIDKEKYALIYGFPNQYSVHGFTKKLGWELLDPIPFIFKPLRSGYFMKKIIGNTLGSMFNLKLAGKKKIRLAKGARIEEIHRFTDDVTTVWNSFSETIKVGIKRDAAYLNWRYVDKPNEDYKIFGYYQDDSLKGCIVFATKKKHGGTIGYMMELLYYPKNLLVGETLVQVALNSMISDHVDVCLAWCLKHAPNYAAFKRRRFMTLIDKLRPIELHFGYRGYHADASLLKKRENWYISYSDSDTV